MAAYCGAQVKMMFKTKRAEAKCSMCAEYYNCEITNISEEIDVYSEWIDACEKVNQEH
jgi:transcription elongation factor Elf1